MDLTEPDAGSDLQAGTVKATTLIDGQWYLNGVKGSSPMETVIFHWYWLVVKEGTSDGRGLSMFIYDKNSNTVTVRRIEHKLGIIGSPTCELVSHL